MPAPLRLLVITYYWPPSGGAGVQRCLKWVKHLPEMGVEPTVITVDPAAAAYPVLDASLEADVPADVRVLRTGTLEPFGAYQKLTNRPIPHGGFANEGRPSLAQRVARFVRGNLFLPDPRRGWNRFVLRQVEELLQAGERFDAVLTSSPPHSTQLIGLELKRRYGMRWLADMRDPWTDIYYNQALHRTALARRIDARYERQVLEAADVVITTSADTRRLLLGKAAGLPTNKFVVLPNGYDEADFRLPSAPPADQLLITYVGTITGQYHVQPFLEEVAACAQRHPEVPLRLRFVGRVGKEVERQIAQAGLQERTELLEFVPHDEAVGYMLRSSALLLAIPKVPHNLGILPGKVFEYMAANKPIICIGPTASDAAHILDETHAGVTLGYDDRPDMREHLEQLVASWQKSPNLDLPAFSHSRYSRRALTQRLAGLIRG
ncbi:glycosyltransferase family 4 protein [Hymenobacter latericus]|uniref:glycosyltransferase family 4 protein n=1 Tax=Hymenobacter sp. YIM 151858-1 TaxID=2987688 RepID=UPI002225CA12|nr:glycosyltransferase family 4 protein [Hymenobacter sp. YIM 151858-1]UYZ60577.1 glycosyltransferase family 4 protein [Hymenobacter sp. YIM 151858-1]